MITANFQYAYDPQSNLFKIRNDGSRYTVSELKWTWVEEYEVYAFTFSDLKYVDIKTKQETAMKDQIPYSFDVSKQGNYVLFYPNICSWVFLKQRLFLLRPI